jgi:hypothetical protein
MALWVSLGIIFALLLVMWIAFGLEPGPGPADVAIAYENAWDKLDFDLLYDLSGEEMRDGLHRAQFVAAKRAAHAGDSARIGAEVVVDDVVATRQTAVVATSVSSAQGRVHNRVMLEKRATGWLVVEYSIRTT